MKTWASLSGLPRDVWILCGATLINRTGTMVLPFLALYLISSLHFSASQSGLVLALYGASAMVSAPLSGVLCDRFGAVRMMSLSLISSAIVLIAFPAAQTFTHVLIATVALSATSAAYVAQFASNRRQGEYMGMYTMSFSIAFTIGPWLGNYLLERYGGTITWSSMFGLSLLSAVLLLAAPRVEPQKPVVSQT